MSKIQQRGPNLWVGPEEFGMTPQFQRTEQAMKHYPKGEILLHEPLQPENKKVYFDYFDEPDDPEYPGDKSAKYLGEVFEGSSAGGHEGYVDMRVNSVTNRSGGFYIMGVIGLLFWWSLHYFVLSYIEDVQMRDLIVYGGYGFFTLGALICLFRPLVTPVRFHKKHQEVYVWHKKVLYRIPWQECEISVRVDNRNVGLKGQQDGYQLTLWLNPKHAVNQDLTGQKHIALNLFHNMAYHAPLYTYWEYVRRYMNSEEPLYIEMSKRPRRPRYNISFAREECYLKVTFAFMIGIPLYLIFKPNTMALFSPFKHKWPEDVHGWTGERCDWH